MLICRKIDTIGLDGQTLMHNGGKKTKQQIDMEIHWPKVKIPEGFNDAEFYLRHLVYQGAEERFVYDENDSNAEDLLTP